MVEHLPDLHLSDASVVMEQWNKISHLKANSLSTQWRMTEYGTKSFAELSQVLRVQHKNRDGLRLHGTPRNLPRN